MSLHPLESGLQAKEALLHYCWMQVNTPPHTSVSSILTQQALLINWNLRILRQMLGCGDGEILERKGAINPSPPAFDISFTLWSWTADSLSFQSHLLSSLPSSHSPNALNLGQFVLSKAPKSQSKELTLNITFSTPQLATTHTSITSKAPTDIWIWDSTLPWAFIT